ncbi:MAG TPA: MBOAT family O-acyltransferase [Acidobacteriaceae bacterium]|nr:MBOAT family O-acyltransferase [Acidobacteriaceae bacterium]
MLFNSLPFLFKFLPVTLVGFHLLGRYGRRPVIAWLAFMSVVFYAAWNKAFVLFLLGSIFANYLAAHLIARSPADSPARKKKLAFGVTLNLLALFYFKYLYKALLLIKALHLAHLNPHPILLPLGISFFTFTQISYLVDLAQGQAEQQDFLSYLLFVTFFPHLIAGPILHHKEMMPQFGKLQPASSANEPSDPLLPVPTSRRFRLKPEDFALGLTWFLLGLGKKVLIADRLAPTADIAFHNAGHLTSANAWVGLITYSMQLYFDFSGYSDMALGLARMFSIRFPLNFDSPYKATSVTEYWQRWHMTLTRYITLYLYNPLLLSIQRRRVLSGKKISRKALATPAGFIAMIAYPTLFTMLLTGIWHGAGLQFALFGLIHGIYLTANQAWRHFRQRTRISGAPSIAVSPRWVGWKRFTSPHTLSRFAMMLGVYLQVTFALIFFRAESTHSAFALLADLFGRHGHGTFDELLAGALAFALFPIVWFFPNTQQILGQEPTRDLSPHPNPTAAALSPTPSTLTGSSPNTSTINSNPAPTPTLLTRLRWTPNLPWAVVMFALFFAILANLDSTARFLYFQF